MNKPGADPKVKKILVRNCVRKITPATRKGVVRETTERAPSPEDDSSRFSRKSNVLGEPRLCSSVALAHYLDDVKKPVLPRSSSDDLNVDIGELNKKITKKLNFHVNDKIYKNLIELNASNDETNMRKQKKVSSVTSVTKKDLEPDIEDFCDDEKEPDLAPKIPIIKPKVKPIRTAEDGSLHKLVASFEVL